MPKVKKVLQILGKNWFQIAVVILGIAAILVWKQSIILNDEDELSKCFGDSNQNSTNCVTWHSAAANAVYPSN